MLRDLSIYFQDEKLEKMGRVYFYNLTVEDALKKMQEYMGKHSRVQMTYEKFGDFWPNGKPEEGVEQFNW